jgi:hypothetical protein
MKLSGGDNPIAFDDTDLLDQWFLLQKAAQIRFPPAFRVPNLCLSRTDD